jgi:hypothetical protein
MAEIAELLGCPIKTAFSRLYVARERVNAVLRRAGCAAWIVPLDRLPLREVAQPPLVSALDAIGVVAPNAAQLSAQLTALASKLAATPTSASASISAFTSAHSVPVLFSAGALAVAAAFALTFVDATAPLAETAPKPKAKATVATRAPSHAETPNVHVRKRAEAARAPTDPASTPLHDDATPTPVESPKLTQAPQRVGASTTPPPRLSASADAPGHAGSPWESRGRPCNGRPSSART